MDVSALKRVAVGMFASAGVAGIALGFAAQTAIANLVSGVIIAFVATHPARRQSHDRRGIRDGRIYRPVLHGDRSLGQPAAGYSPTRSYPT